MRVLVFAFRKGIIDRHVFTHAAALADAAEVLPPSLTRRAAAGRIDIERLCALREDAIGVEFMSPHVGRLRLLDGRVLAQHMSNPVQSHVAGCTVDRFTGEARWSALTRRHHAEWVQASPLFEEIDRAFARTLPKVHARMLARAAVHPGWRIGETALSTVAVNINYESAFHLDAGDFVDGYSTLTVLERGRYDGGLFVLPRYGVAVEVRQGDVLFVQSHVDVHGNTAIVKHTADARRVSFVTYLKHRLALAWNAA